MNGSQLERVLNLIDNSIQENKQTVRGEIVGYLANNSDCLARQISEKGQAFIPTQFGEVRISREDLKAVHP